MIRLTRDERASQGDRLKAARDVAGLTMRGVAYKLGVSVNAVTEYEHGSTPPAERRAILADLYGIDEEVLFCEWHARMDAARALLTR
jgi:transcriptional regulator with XRE-family HTH domain